MFTRMSPLWPAVIRLFPKGSAPSKNRNKTHKCESPTFSLSAAFLGLPLLFDEQSEWFIKATKPSVTLSYISSRYGMAKEENTDTPLEQSRLLEKSYLLKY